LVKVPASTVELAEAGYFGPEAAPSWQFQESSFKISGGF
jgi:hypothetical protein